MSDLTPAAGMLVTPKPFTFGRYTNVTPGKPYTVERVMSATEWFREPTGDGWFMLLIDDKAERYWYSARQFEVAAD